MAQGSKFSPSDILIQTKPRLAGRFPSTGVLCHSAPPDLTSVCFSTVGEKGPLKWDKRQWEPFWPTRLPQGPGFSGPPPTRRGSATPFVSASQRCRNRSPSHHSRVVAASAWLSRAVKFVEVLGQSICCGCLPLRQRFPMQAGRSVIIINQHAEVIDNRHSVHAEYRIHASHFGRLGPSKTLSEKLRCRICPQRFEWQRDANLQS